MKEINVMLMDAPAVLVDGDKKIFPYRRAEGLFYYICVKKRITRDEAIGVFWVDCDEQSARKNLRDALYHIKKIVGSEMIQIKGNVFISVNSDIQFKLDIDEVRDNILENYKGEFLNYFYIKNCLEFEIWMEDYRRELKEQYVQAVIKKVEYYMQEFDFTAVAQYGNKLTEVYYLEEGFYRRVITFFLEEGGYSSAIVLYQKFAAALKQSLEEEPELETKILMDKVLELRQKVMVKPNKENNFFLGRQKEMYEIYTSIQNHLIKKEKLPCNFVLVFGEAGVGKTAILNQIKTVLEDNYKIFSYTCCSAERDLYLKSWNGILNQILEFSKKQKLDLPSSKYFFPSDRMDYKLYITQYGICFEELLRSFCEEFQNTGVVIFLDDIQWMDSSSLQLLNSLLFHLRKSSIFIVAATRLDYMKDISELRVSLMRESMSKEFQIKRFTLEETKELIEACAHELLSEPGSVEKIYQYTHGNALFLTEFLKTLKEKEGESIRDKHLTLRTVSIIQSRLTNFSQEEKDLLSIMSIFANDVTMEDIRILSKESEMKLYQLLEKLLEHQLIIEEVTTSKISYKFTHILFQNYMSAAISTGRRRIYHREVAEYYEGIYLETGNVDLMPVLIYHFEKAHDIYKKYTYKIEYIKVFFSGKQEIYPSMSASFTDKFFSPDLNPSENILIPLAEEIRELSGNDRNYQDLRMKIEYLIGRNDLSSGDYKKGLRNIQACIEAAKYMKNEKYLMDSYLQMIYYSIQVYDLAMMKEYIQYGEDLLKDFDYPEYSVYTMQRLHALYCIKMKQYEAAINLLDDLIPKMERLHRTKHSNTAGLSACYNYRGEIYMKLQEWEEALPFISKAITYCNPDSPPAGLGIAYTNMGIILDRMDNYDKAQEYFERARKCFKNISIQWGKTKEAAYSALLDLKLGKTKGALAHYSAACQHAGKDYCPNTMAMMQEVYDRLIKIPGMNPQSPPSIRMEKVEPNAMVE